MPVPVFLPGERVDCLFEVLLQGVRLEVGREVAGSGADAVMIRELLYDRDSAVAEDDAPEIIAVEGMLLSFVDPACVPGE